MRNSFVWHDLAIVFFVLFLGIALLWAGNNNAIDLFVMLLIVLTPLCTLALVARRWPASDFDNELQ